MSLVLGVRNFISLVYFVRWKSIPDIALTFVIHLETSALVKVKTKKLCQIFFKKLFSHLVHTLQIYD